MRTRSLALLLAFLAFETTAAAGGRTGQAKSVEVLAKRTAVSPRGAHEWGGKANAYIHATQASARQDMRRVSPGSGTMWAALGKHSAGVKMREVIGKHLGLTPGQIASKDRRHDRAMVKQLRRMLREVRVAKASGRPVDVAFPMTMSASYPALEASLQREISSIRNRVTR